MDETNKVLDNFLVKYQGFLECSTLRDDISQALKEFNKVTIEGETNGK